MTHLKRLRAGRKGSITKRIKKLHQLIANNGSRTKIRHLHKALLDVYEDVKDVCSQIAQVTTPTNLDIEWEAKLRNVIDECSAVVEEYLESRKDDDISTTLSMTESWVKRHSASTGEATSVAPGEDIDFDETIKADITEFDAMLDGDGPPYTEATHGLPKDNLHVHSLHPGAQFSQQGNRSAILPASDLGQQLSAVQDRFNSTRDTWNPPPFIHFDAGWRESNQRHSSDTEHYRWEDPLTSAAAVPAQGQYSSAFSL